MNPVENNEVINTEIDYLVELEEHPEKIDYWSVELDNYNSKGKLADMINPVEFKKKLEIVNLLIAIFAVIFVVFFFF